MQATNKIRCYIAMKDMAEVYIKNLQSIKCCAGHADAQMGRTQTQRATIFNMDVELSASLSYHVSLRYSDDTISIRESYAIPAQQHIIAKAKRAP